ncbi:MAG: hypothetical protein NZO58_05845 [Gemmataceae bacterium]|nr:hypothetical protein [Gemmataceae bacterium]
MFSRIGLVMLAAMILAAGGCQSTSSRRSSYYQAQPAVVQTQPAAPCPPGAPCASAGQLPTPPQPRPGF